MVPETAEENITIVFFQNYSKLSFGEPVIKESYFHPYDAHFTIKANNCFGFNVSFLTVK